MIPLGRFRRWLAPIARVLSFFESDKSFLTRKHAQAFGRRPRWDRPQTLNEKILWRSVFGLRPVHSEVADKYRVRDYVRQRIGEEHLVPLLGVYRRASDIPFESLPHGFVLKCNHDSGSAILCNDKSTFDVSSAVRQLNRALSTDYSARLRERQYRTISRLILCEPHLGTGGAYPEEYRFFTFDADEPRVFATLDYYDGGDHRRGFYDEAFRLLPVRRGYELPLPQQPPPRFKEMVALSKILCRGLGFARIDWRQSQGRLYFGEITLSPGAGLQSFEPERWDLYFGSLWDIGEHPVPLPMPLAENETATV